VVHLGRGWYLVRWPYRRRYADYLWMPETTRQRRMVVRLGDVARRVRAWTPIGIRRIAT